MDGHKKLSFDSEEFNSDVEEEEIEPNSQNKNKEDESTKLPNLNLIKAISQTLTLILENNKKSLVYFELTDSRETTNKLNITPKPDSLLRVVIHVKKVKEKVNIKEEKITRFQRKGFTAVEWGGTTY